MADFSTKTDKEIDSWIANHERGGKTDANLYRELLEERAKRQSKILNIEKSLEHLVSIAKSGDGHFTSYGAIAEANGVEWSKARHVMNGVGGHLDNLLDVCHARGLPLLTALCVNQKGVANGTLEPSSLKGFTNGARRLGYQVADGAAFLREQQERCFSWAKNSHR